ncbi:EAL domain-containing protein [Pseudomonas kermanshahensis]|jgi:Predicted signal transduction protein containing sensor and EAL domains|uniref:cyclic-guanylate-specific phosphodiesterase n=1 Tax=Pseudomonas kermanshahensis TaxID=2745482 RepID=A0ABU8R678_9PSED|nr:MULTISPECIES: EAL domain-containing protein [Pseudomonas]MBC3485975.1 EAL domain-containing protein [Pseudomonas sp. SWRI50]MBC3498649.1 EAL domain-containing protein [Pseudomonas sp. SWRI67]MBV4529251.1 EAL domain-containing protein [Pseudomonas kermanshahensis]SME88263.1 sensor c-di-GMP phosphodiesterase, contains CSS-motif sensor and EAL domain [Pseudomonas sp. LAIL14HWK12:I11]SMR68053.1 sensor c-di-GMP phosphodiesterase, contains CSS-motif sensor and EAL domain [Pseudomonas sp. LAIL14HW
MSALIATLRQIFYRPWMLASLAALASAALLLSASIGIALQQMKQSESEQMNAQGERFLDRLEQVFGQLREGVDTLQAQPLRGCSPEMLAALQQVGLSSRFIYEAAYVDAHVACSNRGDERAFEPLRAPDIKGPTYSYWLNTTIEPDENLAALMLGRGNFVVSTSRGHLTDVVDLPPGGSLVVVLDNGTRAIPVLGPPQVWPPPSAWSASHKSLLELSDRLIYRMPTKSPDYQLVLIAPRASLPLRMNGMLWLLFPGSVLAACCIGWLVLQLILQRRSMSSELQNALRRGELQVLYQPIIELDTRRCVGAEALVRWRRPDGTLTSPDLFIPLAENTGQIRQITDFVLQRVLEQLGQLLRSHRNLYISVNLAACDVMVPRIGRVAARLLALHRVAASQIAFEVTERGLIDVVVARDNLQALRAVGHQVLIDDFGTGYCSLAYLQTLPVDCLKIDKAFIDALGHDAASSGVAPHIIRMAHDLHLRVIAEGIECEDQAVLLNSEGVNYGQGWLFARPLNARQFAELVTRGWRAVPARRGTDES